MKLRIYIFTVLVCSLAEQLCAYNYSSPVTGSSFDMHLTSDKQLHSYSGMSSTSAYYATKNHSTASVARHASTLSTTKTNKYAVNTPQLGYATAAGYINLAKTSTYQYIPISSRFKAPPTGEQIFINVLEDWGDEGFAYEIDGIKYYNEQELRRLWDEYIRQNNGQTPENLSWDEWIAWLRNNTTNQTGNYRLPINGGTLAMIVMAIGYAAYKAKIL